MLKLDFHVVLCQVQPNVITTHGKHLPNFHPLTVNQIREVWYSQWLWWSGCSPAWHCINLHSPPSWFLTRKWNLQIDTHGPKNELPKMSPTWGWCALANSLNADYLTQKQSSPTTTNLRLWKTGHKSKNQLALSSQSRLGKQQTESGIRIAKKPPIGWDVFFVSSMDVFEILLFILCLWDYYDYWNGKVLSDLPRIYWSAVGPHLHCFDQTWQIRRIRLQ